MVTSVSSCFKFQQEVLNPQYSLIMFNEFYSLLLSLLVAARGFKFGVKKAVA